MARVHRFSQDDWYAFAGCDKFGDGSDPYTVLVDTRDGTRVQLVADPNGIGAFYERADNHRLQAWTLDRALKPAAAKTTIAKIAKRLNVSESPARYLQQRKFVHEEV